MFLSDSEANANSRATFLEAKAWPLAKNHDLGAFQSRYDFLAPPCRSFNALMINPYFQTVGFEFFCHATDFLLIIPGVADEDFRAHIKNLEDLRANKSFFP